MTDFGLSFFIVYYEQEKFVNGLPFVLLVFFIGAYLWVEKNTLKNKLNERVSLKSNGLL